MFNWCGWSICAQPTSHELASYVSHRTNASLFTVSAASDPLLTFSRVNLTKSLTRSYHRKWKCLVVHAAAAFLQRTQSGGKSPNLRLLPALACLQSACLAQQMADIEEIVAVLLVLFSEVYETCVQSSWNESTQ